MNAIEVVAISAVLGGASWWLWRKYRPVNVINSFPAPCVVYGSTQEPVISETASGLDFVKSASGLNIEPIYIHDYDPYPKTTIGGYPFFDVGGIEWTALPYCRIAYFFFPETQPSFLGLSQGTVDPRTGDDVLVIACPYGHSSNLWLKTNDKDSGFSSWWAAIIAHETCHSLQGLLERLGYNILGICEGSLTKPNCIDSNDYAGNKEAYAAILNQIIDPMRQALYESVASL